jgi:hypothetical protein
LLILTDTNTLVRHLYETGQLLPLAPGKDVWIHDGKIVDSLPKKIEKGSAVWLEVCLTLILYCYFAYSMLRQLVYKCKLRHRRWELAIAIAIVRTHCLARL